MPTGYTAVLDDDPRVDAAKWVTKTLSRAFGVCVRLRDHNFDLTEKQIEKFLEKAVEDDAKYYIELLTETEKTLLEINVNSEEFWKREYETSIKRIKDYNERSNKEASEKKARHNQIRQDLIKLRDNTSDETTKNIAKYGLEQLEVVKSETEPYVSEIPSFEKFQQDKMHSLQRDLTYYNEKLQESREREKGRLLAYQIIKSEVKRILGSDSLHRKVIEE